MQVESRRALAPGPDSRAIAGVLSELRRDAPAVHLELFQRYGEVVRLQAGPFVTHFLFHPDDVKHVLQDAHRRYSKQTYGGRRAHAILGDGLFMTEGERWARQRRLIQAAFVSRDFPRLLAITREAMDDGLARWLRAAEDGQTVEFDDELSNLAFLIIVRVLMSGDFDAEQAAELRGPFEAASREALRVQSMGAPSALERDPGAEAFRRSLERVHEVVMRVIAERRKVTEQDIVTRLIEAGADEQHGFDDQELRDQIKTLLFAGHETSARTAALGLLAAAQAPRYAEQLRDEARAVLDGPGSLLDKVSRLTFTDAFVKEVLRVHSPIWSLERKALTDDEVRGYPIPAGSSVVMSQAVTHFHPEFWERPRDFWPERFLSPDCPRHRLAYFPFGGGPRLCVGNNMAGLQLKLMMACFFKELTVELSPGFTPQFDLALLRRFATGLELRPRRW